MRAELASYPANEQVPSQRQVEDGAGNLFDSSCDDCPTTERAATCLRLG